MLYLCLFHRKGDEGRFADPSVNRWVEDTIVSTYRRQSGEPVKILERHFAETLPADPDTYVIAMCLLACRKSGVAFDSGRDEISYAIDSLEGVPIGTARIRIRAAKPWWRFWE